MTKRERDALRTQQLAKWRIASLERENERMRKTLETLQEFGGLVGTICRHALAEKQDTTELRN